MRRTVVVFLFVVLGLFGSNSANSEELVLEPITKEQIQKGMFEGSISGCAMKVKMFMVGLMGYKDGEEASEIASMKIIESFVQDEYDMIKKEGVAQAELKIMKNFQTCIEEVSLQPEQEIVLPKGLEMSEIDKDSMAEQKARKQQLANSCGGMNALVLTTLNGIQKQTKQEEIEAMAKEFKLDVSETMLELMAKNDPELYIVKNLYGEARKDGYDKAIEQGFAMVSSCIGMKY